MTRIMSASGHGNFDSDTARDWLAEFTDGLRTEIEDAMRDPECLAPDEYEGTVVPCQIQILCELDETGRAPQWPKPEIAERWKQVYLKAWDAAIDGLKPTPKHKAARRATLVDTFDRMLALARRQHA